MMPLCTTAMSPLETCGCALNSVTPAVRRPACVADPGSAAERAPDRRDLASRDPAHRTYAMNLRRCRAPPPPPSHSHGIPDGSDLAQVSAQHCVALPRLRFHTFFNSGENSFAYLSDGGRGEIFFATCFGRTLNFLRLTEINYS